MADIDQAAIREQSRRIPGGLNIGLAAAASALALFLLWFVCHTPSWGWTIVAAVAFSFVNNTLFSLLHESVHGMFHANRSVNEWGGRWVSAFFPTSLNFQRICHLGHHQRNRTDVELFDYYKPEDSKVVKYVQWYSILTGLYWVTAPIACLIYLLCPGLFKLNLFHEKVGRQTSADAMLSGFEHAPATKIRLEVLMSFGLQILLFFLLDLNLLGWFICYAAFALNWSSLQYADHAWSERDVVNGAWNLRVNKVVQYLFLNYHHHKVHHQHPGLPWIHLSRHIDPAEPRPSFLSIYLKMWLGPRPYPDKAIREPDAS